MAVTTKKEFKTLVQAYIINSLSTDYTEDLKEQLQTVVDEFKNWWNPNEQKRTPNRSEAFKQFLLCLPSCMSVDYYDDGILEIYKGWFINSGNEFKEAKTDKQRDQQLEYFFHFLYREFSTLCKKNGINF